MLGIVLAAGEGRRLRPVTGCIPKPLIPVGGRRMIDYAVEGLLDTVDGVVVVAGYLGEMIFRYIRRRYGDRVGVYVVTRLTGGNARTLFQIRDLILGQDVLITSSDRIFFPEFFIDLKSRRRDDVAVLACYRERTAPVSGTRVLASSNRVYMSRSLPAYEGVYIGSCVVPDRISFSFVGMLSFLSSADDYEFAFRTVPCRFEWMDDHPFFELDTYGDWRNAVEVLRYNMKYGVWKSEHEGAGSGGKTLKEGSDEVGTGPR